MHIQGSEDSAAMKRLFGLSRFQASEAVKRMAPTWTLVAAPAAVLGAVSSDAVAAVWGPASFSFGDSVRLLAAGSLPAASVSNEAASCDQPQTEQIIRSSVRIAANSVTRWRIMAEFRSPVIRRPGRHNRGAHPGRERTTVRGRSPSAARSSFRFDPADRIGPSTRSPATWRSPG